MARIESGLDKRDPAEAFMTTYDWARKNRLQNEAGQREQAQLMLQVQQAYMENQREQAKSQQLLNEQAQMGSAEALQQLSMQMQAGSHPGAKMLKDAMGTLSRISDPKARAVGVQAFHGAMTELQKRHHQKAAHGMLEDAGKDGDVFQPEQVQDWQSRMQAGEDPKVISKEVMGHREKHATELHDTQENEVSFQQAQQLVQAAPPGYGKRAASIALNMAMSSTAARSKPGAGALALGAVQKALLGTADDYEKQQQAHKQHLQETLGPGSQAPGLGGMTTGERTKEMEKQPHTRPLMPFEKRDAGGGPNIPPLQGVGTHATLKRGQQPATASRPGKNSQVSAPALPKDKILAAKSEEDLVKALQESGVPLTHANLSAAANLWRPSE
jgi:hypothetical protein